MSKTTQIGTEVGKLNLHIRVWYSTGELCVTTKSIAFPCLLRFPNNITGSAGMVYAVVDFLYPLLMKTANILRESKLEISMSQIPE